MKVFFFALVYIFSLQIVAMEAGFKYPSNDIYRWQECGEQPKYSFDPDMVTQREVVTVENNISDWLSGLIKKANQTDGKVDANELQKINDFLKGDSIARADMLAQRYNKSGDVLIRIPSAQVDKIWQKVYTAFNNKKIGQRIKISPVGDDQNHRLYVFAPDCYDNTNEMHKIISALKELGLDPVEYQPTSYFDLGLRFTKKISELKPSKK